jgi:DNA polymerase-4
MDVERPPQPAPVQAVRRIIHMDMDAFYASVEIRDRPELKPLPVVVGGPPASRSVVLAANYEARKYGVRSAIPCSRAQRLCPQAVFIPPDFSKYRAASQQIHAIFRRYTPLVEGVSLDEAYLDVTAQVSPGRTATQIARDIKRDIRAETGLTASAGVAFNKFLAKIASDVNKPDGLFVIPPERAAAFLAELPVGRIPGVGRVTQAALEALGIHSCGDLARWSLDDLEERFGRRGATFYEIARGQDERPVEPNRERKSISIEDTFPADAADPAWLLERVRNLAGGLSRRARAAGVRGRTVTLKLKLADFKIFTRSDTLPSPTDRAEDLLEAGTRLFRQSGLVGQKFRLLGLGLSQLDDGSAPAPPPNGQLSLPLEADGAGPA